MAGSVAGYKAEVEATDAGSARCGGRQAHSTPRRVRRGSRSVAARVECGLAIGPGERALTDDDQRALGRGNDAGKAQLAGGELGERIGTGAEMLVGIGEVDPLADQPDLEVALAPPPADAGVEHRRFAARIGADDENGVGAIDAGDARVEQV